MDEDRVRGVARLFGAGKRRALALVAIGAALAVGVPLAWASFSDVPPSNPFYADINAIQGAGITGGCGGGNFCPTDNITRQAEAAFAHRGMPRVGFGFSNGVTVPSGGVELGNLTITIPGVPGQTQFVMGTATVDTQIQSLTGCPCKTEYGIYQDGVGYRIIGDSMNDSLPAAGGSQTDGLQSASSSGVVSVPSGTTQTFHIYAFLVGGTGTVTGYGTLSAITAPFGSTGSNVLGVDASKLAERVGRSLPQPPK